MCEQRAKEGENTDRMEKKRNKRPSGKRGTKDSTNGVNNVRGREKVDDAYTESKEQGGKRKRGGGGKVESKH